MLYYFNTTLLIGLYKLEELYLNNNKLAQLSSNLFHDLISIKRIDLQSNQLRDLDSDAFKSLNNLTTINLFNNNWTMDWLKLNIEASVTEVFFLNKSSNDISMLIDPVCV